MRARDFEFEKGKDYYLENGMVILTERYLMKRGTCCGSGCRHCCFDPIHTKGNAKIKENLDKDVDRDIY
jgi:hypothetical protein